MLDVRKLWAVALGAWPGSPGALGQEGQGKQEKVRQEALV